MVAEAVAALAVAGALTGAGLNAIRAWYQAPEDEKFSWKRFSGGLLSGGLAALALVNFLQINVDEAGGYIATFIGFALQGAGASTLISKAQGG